MPVFSDVLVAPNETDHEMSREDILLMCRLYREERIARMSQPEQRKDEKAA